MTTATQLDGFEYIQAKLGKCEGEVLAFIRANPGVTRNELDAALGGGNPNASYSRRLSRLEENGWIERGQAKDCPVTGHPASTWWPVKGQPRPKPRPEKSDPVVALATRIEGVLAGPPSTLFADPRVAQALEIVREVREGRAAS